MGQQTIELQHRNPGAQSDITSQVSENLHPGLCPKRKDFQRPKMQFVCG